MLGISSVQKLLSSSTVFNSHMYLQGITYLHDEDRKRAELGNYQQWRPLSSLKKTVVAPGKRDIFVERQHCWANWLEMTTRQARDVAKHLWTGLWVWQRGDLLCNQNWGNPVIKQESLMGQRRIDSKRREEYTQEIHPWSKTSWKRGCPLGICKQRLLHHWQGETLREKVI